MASSRTSRTQSDHDGSPPSAHLPRGGGASGKSRISHLGLRSAWPLGFWSIFTLCNRQCYPGQTICRGASWPGPSCQSTRTRAWTTDMHSHSCGGRKAGITGSRCLGSGGALGEEPPAFPWLLGLLGVTHLQAFSPPNVPFVGPTLL